MDLSNYSTAKNRYLTKVTDSDYLSINGGSIRLSSHGCFTNSEDVRFDNWDGASSLHTIPKEHFKDMVIWQQDSEGKCHMLGEMKDIMTRDARWIDSGQLKNFPFVFCSFGSHDDPFCYSALGTRGASMTSFGEYGFYIVSNKFDVLADLIFKSLSRRFGRIGLIPRLTNMLSIREKLSPLMAGRVLYMDSYDLTSNNTLLTLFTKRRVNELSGYPYEEENEFRMLCPIFLFTGFTHIPIRWPRPSDFKLTIDVSLSRHDVSVLMNKAGLRFYNEESLKCGTSYDRQTHMKFLAS